MLGLLAAMPVGLLALSMGPAQKKPASSGGGFGAPKRAPLTLEQVCAGFKSRLPKDAGEPCPCGSGSGYQECCRPYHAGERAAESPERCLRSRYSGFAYRLPRYIIGTTHRSNRDWQSDKVKWARKLDREQMFDSFRFEGLEVGELEAGSSEEEAFLSLRVTLQPFDPATGLQTTPEPMVFSERSKFVRNSKGAWLYAAGDVTSEEAGFKGRTLTGEADLKKMQDDVEFVQKVVRNTPNTK